MTAKKTTTKTRYQHCILAHNFDRQYIIVTAEYDIVSRYIAVYPASYVKRSPTDGSGVRVVFEPMGILERSGKLAR